MSMDTNTGKSGVELGAYVTPRKWTPRQPLVIGLTVIVSAVALMGMRQIGMRSAIAFEGEQSGFDFQGDAQLQTRYERLMADLGNAKDPLDVALSDFGNSPFAMREAIAPLQQAVAAKPMAGESPEEAARRSSAARKTALLNEAGKLTLHSVMGGKRPLARINEETVTVGDTIAEYFTVTEIEGRSVTITADGESFTLTMQAGNAPPASGQSTPKRRP